MGKFKVNGEISATSHISTNGWFTCSGVSHSNGWALGLNAYDKDVSAVLGGIGFYGASNGVLRKIFLTFGEESWNSTLGLTLSSDGTGRLNNSLILTAANFNDYSPTLTGTGASGTWSIGITGNAGTATKLATARTISLTGSVTGSGSFDGSGNLSISTTTNHTHSYLPLDGGQMSGPIYMGSTATKDGPSIVFFSNKRNYIWMGYANDNGSWYIWDSHNSKGIIHSDANGNNTFFGNADTATKLATARTISLTGSVTGSGSFDGSGNLSIASTVADDSHNHIISNVDNLQSSLDNRRIYYTNTIDLSSSTYKTSYYYPCVLSAIPYTGFQMIRVACQLNTNVPSWSTHSSGFTVNFEIWENAGGWGTTEPHSICTEYYHAFCDTNPVGYRQMYQQSKPILYLRGGGKYRVITSYEATWTVHTASYSYGSYSGMTVEPTTTNPGLPGMGGTIRAAAVYGAVWNDYAEYRSTTDAKPGEVIIENGDGTLHKSHSRLEPGANIISDTFGFAIGETEQTKTPIAVAGRVLAYPYEDRYSYKPGAAVCSAPDGKVSQMTREEIINYPDCIVGYVSEIPEYETWGTGNVKVDNRIWIKVK